MPDTMSPFGMTGMPGANTGGTNMAVPTASSNNTPSVGGQTNPFIPQYPGGTSMAPMSSSINGAGGPNVSPNAPAGLNVFQNSAQGYGWNQEHADNFVNQLTNLGYPQETAELLHNFMTNGAGFNPQVADALIKAMQPQVQRGQADILEQFSTQGLRGGSPAAIGFADYMSNVQLNEGQIFAKLYEDSVQNYMKVLLGPAATQQGSSTFDDFLNFGTQGSNILSTLATAGKTNRT